MPRKVLRVTVQGGRLMAIYDDRLAGLIERLGGARSGDDGADTGGRSGGDPSSPGDGSRRVPLRRSHTDRPGAHPATGGPSCKPDSSIVAGLRGSVRGICADAHADRPLGTYDRSGRWSHVALYTKSNHHASADAGYQTHCYCSTFLHVEQMSRSRPSLVITRASHVEPGPDGGWTADMAPVGGGVLGPFPRRADALQAEQAWLRQERGL